MIEEFVWTDFTYFDGPGVRESVGHELRGKASYEIP
jgi:hypothetical protein